MLARLGNVLLWTGYLASAGISYLVYKNGGYNGWTAMPLEDRFWMTTGIFIPAILGSVFRYILAGGHWWHGGN